MKYSNIKPLNFINGKFSKQEDWFKTNTTKESKDDELMRYEVLHLALEVNYKIIMN